MSKSGLLNKLLIKLLENNKSLSNLLGKFLVLDELLPGKPLVLQGKSSVLQGRSSVLQGKSPVLQGNPLVLQGKWLVVGELLQGRLCENVGSGHVRIAGSVLASID